MLRNSEDKGSFDVFDVTLILPESIDKVVSFIPVLGSIPAEEIARWPEAKTREDGVLVLGGLEPHYHPSVIAYNSLSMKTTSSNPSIGYDGSQPP